VVAVVVASVLLCVCLALVCLFGGGKRRNSEAGAAAATDVEMTGAYDVQPSQVEKGRERAEESTVQSETEEQGEHTTNVI